MKTLLLKLSFRQFSIKCLPVNVWDFDGILLISTLNVVNLMNFKILFVIHHDLVLLCLHLMGENMKTNTLRICLFSMDKY